MKRRLLAQFILSPLVAGAGAALGVAVGYAWVGLLVGLALGCALALVLAWHLQVRLRRIRAMLVSGLVRPTAVEANNEIDAIGAAVERYVSAIQAQQRDHVEESEHQAFVLERMNDGLLRVAADGRVRYANAAAAALFGRRRAVGQPLLRLTRDDQIGQLLERCLATGDDQQMTITDPESRRLISVVIARIDDAPPEALVTLRDITEMRRLQTLRRDFVANVSHELRTPLSTLRALTETLLDLRRDDAEALRFLSKIDAEIVVMSALVDDLLALSRLESQPDSLSLEAVDPGALIAEIRERMEPIASAKGLALSADAPAELPTVTGDPRWLRQALTNLVSNAIQHTPEGGAVNIAAAEEGRCVTFRVRDTGSGIAPEHLERVWERFYKADRSRSGAGTGLGLAIVKHIALAHHGAVSATSTVDKGSEFRISIPRSA